MSSTAGGFDPERLKAEIRREILAQLPRHATTSGPALTATTGGATRRDLVTESDVMSAHRGAHELLIARAAIVTPLARDAADRYGVKIVVDEPAAAGASGRAAAGTAKTPAPPSAAAGARPAAPGNPAVLAARVVTARPSRAGVAAGCCPDVPTVVAIASDHAGYLLKEAVKRHLESGGFQVVDFGTDDARTSVDYPDYVVPAAAAVARGAAARAVLVDCHGNASAMAANKVPGVRAAASRSIDETQSSREHGDSNVLCLGQKVLSPEQALAIVDCFLSVDFAGDRHARRLAKVAAVESAFCRPGAAMGGRK